MVFSVHIEFFNLFLNKIVLELDENSILQFFNLHGFKISA